MEQEELIKNKDYLTPFSILFVAGLIIFAWLYSSPSEKDEKLLAKSGIQETGSEALIIPLGSAGLLTKLKDSGAIDWNSFESLYNGRGGFSDGEKNLLKEFDEGEVRITDKNSGVFLNLLWAFGLANKNVVLEEGPMTSPVYGGANNFASTGGWSLSRGSAMGHYSRHALVSLTREQQALVERASKNIFRPCCDNSTYFPDCNHGMAMLGLLEILAAQDVSEETLYLVALKVNRLWFPEQYAMIEKYLSLKHMQASAREILGRGFSSASGLRKIMSSMPVETEKGGASCGA